MKLAWLGPVGSDGGVPAMGTLLLEHVLGQGIEVDFFTSSRREALPVSLQGFSNLEVVTAENSWRWGRWYSRTPFISFLSGTYSRAQVQKRLATMLIERNHTKPYDCVFQFSIAELFKLGRHLEQLPPVVVYPCVHAAGELRWHRRESAYARRSESLPMHYLVRLFLRYRTWLQRGQYRKPAMLVGMSRRFNQLVAADYGVDASAMGVMYHPIRFPERARPSAAASPPRRPFKLLYVSRISVRKGLEQIVELSYRLDDLRGKVEIEVIGGRTQWSDYTRHLADLNPHTAKYVGSLANTKLAERYHESDILLLPSMYEPGGIVVGEALSHGMCVVASDEVGSAEPVSVDCCRTFAAGDVDQFEKCVRTLMDDLTTRGAELRARAAEEARRHFEPSRIAAQLVEHLRTAIARTQTQKIIASQVLPAAIAG
jgi:glycosyltransferase involved in cell wall biosynthesis